MYYADLGRKTQIARGPFIRAVGWLSASHPFPTGPVSEEFLTKLKTICVTWAACVAVLKWPIALGPHTCEFCRKFHASGNVGVPANDLLFVAPEMIAHYVEAHDYVPPHAFVEAVMRAPLPGSSEYVSALRHFADVMSHAG
jgi:hypothetical protein